MSASKFKRALWALNEFTNASSLGISIEELSYKWSISSMNDEKEPGIPERTFHRIRRMVESVFGVTIECIKVSTPRYRVASEDRGPGNNTLFDLILNKATSENVPNSSSIRDVLKLVMGGKDISTDDMCAVKAIIRKLNRIPSDYGEQLITSVKAGDIHGADCANWDEDYKGYVCIWNNENFNRTDLWLSIGIYDDHILFYVVTSVQDNEYRNKISQLLQVDSGEMYRSAYWWYEPVDKSLFQLDFQTFPNMQEIKRRSEILLSRIAALPRDVNKPKE